MFVGVRMAAYIPASSGASAADGRVSLRPPRTKQDDNNHIKICKLHPFYAVYWIIFKICVFKIFFETL
jgi:hypothetical protein